MKYEHAWQTFSRMAMATGLPQVFRGRRSGVLMYHSVGDPKGYGNVSVERFRDQIAYVAREFEPVDLPSVLEQGSSEKRIAVTFDDAYENVVTKALPVLREYEVPATVFVVTDFVNGRNRSYNHRPVVDEAQLTELVSSDLVTIGNHTRTHPRLAEVESETDQRAEILGAKQWLEDRFNIEIDRFSFPHGSFDDDALRIVANSHEYAVTTVPLLLSGDQDPIRIPRLHAHVPSAQIRFDMTDAGDIVKRIGNGIFG